MVNIKIINKNPIIAECRKSNEEEIFYIKIDPDTFELLEQPEKYDIDFSTAYSHIFNLLYKKKEIPEEMVSEWG